MPDNSILDLKPAGSALFFDSESFLNDLSEDDESMLTGGRADTSNSRLIRLRKIRRIRILRRRRLILRRRRLAARRRKRSTT